MDGLKAISTIEEKAKWVRKKTLELHKMSPETRIASCLSDIEIFSTLFYGKILKFDPKNPLWEQRDRFIISKAHGAVSLYPILADMGFFDMNELNTMGTTGSRLTAIPDCRVPGFETINGSLGHGLGVACGVALALKRKHNEADVFVLCGDGELFEGSMWEAIMFASQHRLDNLILIVDKNHICMLDRCNKIIDLDPLEKKFETFGWVAKVVDGHNINELYYNLLEIKKQRHGAPKVVIANTVKGKGVPKLENDVLCHIKSLNASEIDEILKRL